jgi:hypothetical protein
MPKRSPQVADTRSPIDLIPDSSQFGYLTTDTVPLGVLLVVKLIPGDHGEHRAPAAAAQIGRGAAPPRSLSLRSGWCMALAGWLCYRLS